MTNMLAINIRVSEAFKDEVRAYARRNKIPLNEAARRLIQVGLNDDLQRRKQAGA